MSELYCLADFEKLAKETLPKNVFDYFAGGSGDEETLIQNMDAYNRIKVSPRVLRDVRVRSLSTCVMGHTIRMPILAAPMAFQKLSHEEGEVGTAKAFNEQGSIMIVSTCSTCSLKNIAEASAIPPWFQLYLYKDRSLTLTLIRLVESLGYGAIVITVDAPVYAKRLRERRTPLILSDDYELKHLEEIGLNLQNISPQDKAPYLASLLDPSVTWKDILWICQITSLPVLLKGIMHPDDALLAAQHDVSAIIVSNHGGRQLDITQSSIEALPAIVKTVGEKLEILVDGGIRKGSDILKALSLGAKAVLIGRPVLWGLSAGGKAGVEQTLKILCEELDMSMALCGYTSIEQVQQEGYNNLIL